MTFTPLDLFPAFTISPKIISDERGHFFESFRDYLVYEYLETLTENKHQAKFVQENQSYSKKNVFRGFHFQIGTFRQAKLVRVVRGEIIDIIVDVRSNSNTFGQKLSVTLSENNNLQLYVPRGFAHGFLVTSEDAIVQYKCDSYYSKEHERGLNPLDPALNLNWPTNVIINERDKNWPMLHQIENL